ncbi:MAG: lysoplasmalogenase [Saprospiraceae bacterium]|nr:lysoplasmalogenase [Saprospiraceae bacterium]
MKNTWKILFGIACIVHLIALLLGQPGLAFASKPFLMPLLALWFASETKNNQYVSRMWIAGLVFSTLGDVLLMFTKGSGEIFFVLGLAAFLLAHLFYISASWRILQGRTGFLRSNPAWALLPLAYLALLLWILWPGVPAGLRLPVGAYGLVITTMALSVLQLRTYIPVPHFRLMMLGAVLFVLSDSLLALDKFAGVPAVPLSIMATYIFGQVFMTIAVMRVLNEKS